MKTMTRIALGCVVGAFALTGCSSYDREDFIEELQEGEAGISEAVAICITDQLEEKIGVDRMGARGNPTAEEEAIMTEVSLGCFLGE